MRHVLILGGVLMLVVVGVLALARQQTPMPQWIYFQRNNQLHRVTWNGNRVEALPLAAIELLRISPDGKWLLWREVHGSEMFLSDIHLTETRTLTNQGAAPRWSPDSRQIIVIRNDNMFLIDRISGESDYIMAPPGYEFNVEWSPDGEWLVFNARLGGEPGVFKADVFKIRPDSTGYQQFGVPPWGVFPVWSPDGEWIAFSVGEDYDKRDVYKMHPDGSEQQNLTNTENIGETFINWDAIGDRMIYRVHDGGFFLMEADGRDGQLFVDFSFSDSYGWCDDWFIYAYGPGPGDSDLYRYNVQTRERVQLTDSAVPDVHPYVAPPIDLDWHSETLAIGAAIALGVTAIPMLRRKRVT